MREPIDPKIFGLHPTAKIDQTGDSEFVLVIRRKSRIVMKDGENILKKVAQIRAYIPNATVHVQTSAPVCSKTKAFLLKNDIRVEK